MFNVKAITKYSPLGACFIVFNSVAENTYYLSANDVQEFVKKLGQLAAELFT